MNIAYSCNDYYIPQTGISIISLLENNQSVDEIVIYLISKDISKENIKIIDQICAKYGRKLVVIPFEQIAYDLKLSATGRHIETVYTKIFFPRIEGLKKCLYIDSDTIIVDSLVPLWEMDLTDKYLAAVETISTKYKKKLGLKPENVFFNDGMTLMNVDYCREHQLIKQAIELINKYDGNPPVLSEGVLNSICKERVEIISMKYNLMSGMYQIGIENPKYLSSITSYNVEEIVESCQNPVIIHYLSGFYNRPWFRNCTHPLKKYYLENKSKSPWAGDELACNNLSQKLQYIEKLTRLLGADNIMRLSRMKQSVIKS